MVAKLEAPAILELVTSQEETHKQVSAGRQEHQKSGWKCILGTLGVAERGGGRARRAQARRRGLQEQAGGALRETTQQQLVAAIQHESAKLAAGKQMASLQALLKQDKNGKLKEALLKHKEQGMQHEAALRAEHDQLEELTRKFAALQQEQGRLNALMNASSHCVCAVPVAVHGPHGAEGAEHRVWTSAPCAPRRSSSAFFSVLQPELCAIARSRCTAWWAFRWAPTRRR